MMSSEQGLAHRKVSINVSCHYKQRRLAYFSNYFSLHPAVSSASACFGQRYPKLSEWLCGACQSDTEMLT